MKRIAIALSLATLWPASATPNPPSTEQVVVMPNARTLLPPSERPWTAADYETALLILSHVSPDKLPASWPEPSAIFLRIVNPENLETLRDMQEPLYQRMVDARRYLIATAKITACYLPDIKQNQEHREDVARLEGFFVQELGALMALVREMETLSPADFDKRAALDPYVDKIKQDLDKIVGDVAESLEAHQSRSEEARLRLAHILTNEYPRLSAFLSPPTRKKVEAILSQFPEPAAGTAHNTPPEGSH